MFAKLMKSIKHFFSLFLLTILLFGFTVNEECGETLKNKNFTYKNGSKEVFVSFKETKYIEYHNKKKFFIKSNIEWVSDCEYYLIIQESTIPNFPFDSGTKMHIIINKVKGKKLYYTCTLAGRSWEGILTKANETK